MTSPYLSPEQVVQRYCGHVSIRTLKMWRDQATGPAFVKVGASVLYAVADLEVWEQRNRIRTDGSAPRTIAGSQDALQADANSSVPKPPCEAENLSAAFPASPLAVKSAGPSQPAPGHG